MLSFRAAPNELSIGGFCLLYICLNQGITFIDDLIGITTSGETFPITSTLVVGVMALPMLAVGSRRLHDRGRSGWWQLLWITLIGGLLLMFWMAKKRDLDENSFGSPPQKN
jgi:uncharacterized membrane protein YhaH (DUF805 family)